ncbi:MAG: hypothetical protein JXA69_08245 [Phycisphaerae bacterium]|nr:hypothetical protein [Phycisphaerae bacterium]
MKLTEKDKTFLETLKRLLESKDLSVEFKPGQPSHLVLRGTYGEHIHEAFRMTRQGARWRFQRLFNEIYVSAFETILFIERIFGTQLREHAMRISQERYALRQQAAENSLQTADSLEARRQRPTQPAEQGERQM